MRRLNSNTAFYKDMMGIKAVTAVSDTELHLEYDALDRSVVLMLAFDPLTKRLVNDLTRDGLDQQLQNEAWAQTRVGQAEDAGEGRKAFLERREPQWTGR